MSFSQPLVSLRGITKRFPGVLANDAIDLHVYAGEVHALVGENGAGKTTLMKILSGIYRPDAGEIWVDGRKVVLRSPQEARELGIGMAFQHFALIPSMTVAENVALGWPGSGLRLPLPHAAARLADLGRRYGLAIDPRARIWQLSVGEQQRAEILKLLAWQARILILDEPTAALTPQEARSFLQSLQALAATGHTVIFISHKLDEVLMVAQRITVLRQGRVVTSLPRAAADKRALARAMIGREPRPPARPPAAAPGEVVLAVRELSARDDRGRLALQRVSFELRRGEILGIAGVAGNGQRELGEVLVGLRPAATGTVWLHGRDVTGASPGALIRLGVGHIPEDRLGMGLVPQAGVLDNLLLKMYRAPPFAWGPLLRRRVAAAAARRLLAEFRVAVPRLDAPVSALSGGTQQRLLLARELSMQPRVLVAFHPTRGLDVAAVEQVHRVLLEQRQRGCALLLISEDLDELSALADRIAVMCDGEVTGIVERDAADRETLGLLMAGRLEGSPAPTPEAGE
jgi:simple sugar transport system ATP-binding protein